MPAVEEQFWTTREVAKRLRVCSDWVRRAFRCRPGVVRLGAGHMRIPESAVQDLLRERGYLQGYIHERNSGEKVTIRTAPDRKNAG